MSNIRELCKIWSEKTYKDGIEYLYNEDAELYSLATKIFTKLKILDIPMDGYSCEHLPKTEESRTGIKKTYSEIFHEEINKIDFSPATYLVKLLYECKKTTDDEAQITGALARGLRTLTSLLREPDFAFMIEENLIIKDKNAETSLNAKQDSGDHTDILLQYKNTEYRIWLYQFSSRGLPHDIERLTGKRGELPPGNHLICPLKTELAIEYDKLRKKKFRLQTRLKQYRKKLSECSVKAVKKREGIALNIKKTEEEIKKLLPELKKCKKVSDNELDIVCGWYFYSESHIKRIIKYIDSGCKPMQYQKLVKILSAPEKFISEIHMFEKGE